MYHFMPDSCNTLPIYFWIFRGKLLRYIVCRLPIIIKLKRTLSVLASFCLNWSQPNPSLIYDDQRIGAYDIIMRHGNKKHNWLRISGGSHTVP